MSEYQFVERPLLTQLDSMGWTVMRKVSGSLIKGLQVKFEPELLVREMPRDLWVD